MNSPLHSHRLPLVEYFDMAYLAEFHKFVFWQVISSTSCPRLRFPWSIVIFDGE